MIPRKIGAYKAQHMFDQHNGYSTLSMSPIESLWKLVNLSLRQFAQLTASRSQCPMQKIHGDRGFYSKLSGHKLYTR